MPGSKLTRRDKIDEIHFLADGFDVAPIRATEMIAEGEEAEDLAAAAMEEEFQRDPLADVPLPDTKGYPDHLEKDVADLGKPVVPDLSTPS